MRAIGLYMMRGRLHAVGVLSLLTLVSWLFAPFAYLLAGAPLGLVTLRQGAAAGIQVMVGAFLVIGAMAIAVGFNPALAPAFALGVWGPVWLCSVVLRTWPSQGPMIMAAGAAGAAFALLMYAAVGDVAGWWRQWFETWFQVNLPPDTAQHYIELLERVVPMLNAMMAAGLVLSLSVTMLAARWWQAALFNPGGFQAEFHGLRLPRTLAFPALVGIVLMFTVEPPVRDALRDLVVVIMVVYLFQGVAAVHRTVLGRRLSRAWLVGMYGLLLLVPQMILFMACLGMADSWMNRPLPPGSGQSGTEP